VRLVQATSKRLGRPLPRRRLLVAVCNAPSCTVSATALLRVTSRARGRVQRTTLRLGTLRLAQDGAAPFDLRLSAAQRRTIRRARAATILVTAVAGGQERRFSYRVSVA
jgi:hypothetical protein